MKSINKTKIFAIFAAVLMAIATTSCLDPLDSVDGMVNVSIAPHGMEPVIWDLMCQTGELDILFDRFAFALALAMHYPTARDFLIHNLLYERHFFRLKDLIDEEVEIKWVIVNMLNYSISFNCFLDEFPDMRISMPRHNIEDLRARHKAGETCSLVVVYKPCDYNPETNALTGYSWWCREPIKIEDLASYDDFVFVVEFNMRTNGILGDEINDPYAIHNMRQARLNFMDMTGMYMPEIYPNKKYIRFLPRDEYELDLLTSDSTFILFEFPLHYEIGMNENCFHHNSNLPEGAVPWQYVVVPIYKTLPNVKYELLYYVFIPDLNADESEDCYYDLLMYEAYKLTGNLNESDYNQMSTRFFRPTRWHASGRITVFDNNLGQRPLVGATVRVQRFTRTERAVTDRDGRFHAGRFIYSARYSIQWSTPHFSIRAGTIFQAQHKGPKQREAWYLNIVNDATEVSRLQNFYATIHRAAFHYYYGDIRGLRRPPGDPFRPMRIAAVDRGNPDRSGRFSPVLPNQIKVWNNYRFHNMLTYANVIHELTHASHWRMVGTVNFLITSDHVRESWANGVAWELTRMVYSGYEGHSSPSNRRTHVVMDMIDTRSNDNNPNGARYPHDRVEGYTIRQIEDALIGVVTWNQWRDNIKRRYNNATSIHLDALFDYWSNR